MKEIQLTKNKIAFVDDEDFDFLSQWKWYVSVTPDGQMYAARRNEKNEHISMHRLILKANIGQIVDHKDCNTLNNQKLNLRVCNATQNSMNRRKSGNQKSSKYKGVSWHKAASKWESCIQINGKKIYLGCFDTELEAAIQYNKKAVELFGEFCNLNQV